MNKGKSEGITLIALVITIIILLILAGVSLSLVMGEEGLIGRTISAREVNENAEEKELVELAVSTAQIDGHGNLTTDNLNNALKEKFNNDTGVSEISEGWGYQRKRSYKIYQNGKVEEIGEGQIILPAGYQQVEYIESTGEQYIDTEYKPNQDTRIIADFQYTMNNKGYRFTGEEYNGTKFRFGTSNGIYWMLGYGSQEYQRLGSSDTNRHTLDFNKNNIYLDNTLLYSYNYETFASDYNMYIFSINSDSIADLSPTKLYSYKIYDNDTLVRNFIPALDKNGVVCLYDTVTKKTFYNKGTGIFYCTKNKYTECEYIESTGQQYIDTEYKPNQDTRIIADFQYTMNNKGYRFTGEEYNGTKFRFGTSNGIYWMLGYGSQEYQRLGSSDTNRHTLDFNKNNIYLDNTLLYSYNYENFTSNHNMYIFSIKSDSIADLSPTKLYSYKIYDNDTLVRNFIPRLNKGVPCLYDTVTNKSFYNQGTGTLSYKIKE